MSEASNIQKIIYNLYSQSSGERRLDLIESPQPQSFAPNSPGYVPPRPKEKEPEPYFKEKPKYRSSMQEIVMLFMVDYSEASVRQSLNKHAASMKEATVKIQPALKKDKIQNLLAKAKEILSPNGRWIPRIAKKYNSIMRNGGAARRPESTLNVLNHPDSLDNFWAICRDLREAWLEEFPEMENAMNDDNFGFSIRMPWSNPLKNFEGWNRETRRETEKYWLGNGMRILSADPQEVLLFILNLRGGEFAKYKTIKQAIEESLSGMPMQTYLHSLLYLQHGDDPNRMGNFEKFYITTSILAGIISIAASPLILGAAGANAVRGAAAVRTVLTLSQVDFAFFLVYLSYVSTDGIINNLNEVTVSVANAEKRLVNSWSILSKVIKNNRKSGLISEDDLDRIIIESNKINELVREITIQILRTFDYIGQITMGPAGPDAPERIGDIEFTGATKYSGQSLGQNLEDISKKSEDYKLVAYNSGMVTRDFDQKQGSPKNKEEKPRQSLDFEMPSGDEKSIQEQLTGAPANANAFADMYSTMSNMLKKSSFTVEDLPRVKIELITLMEQVVGTPGNPGDIYAFIEYLNKASEEIKNLKVTLTKDVQNVSSPSSIESRRRQKSKQKSNVSAPRPMKTGDVPHYQVGPGIGPGGATRSKSRMMYENEFEMPKAEIAEQAPAPQKSPGMLTMFNTQTTRYPDAKNEVQLIKKLYQQISEPEHAQALFVSVMGGNATLFNPYNNFARRNAGLFLKVEDVYSSPPKYTIQREAASKSIEFKKTIADSRFRAAVRGKIKSTDASNPEVAANRDIPSYREMSETIGPVLVMQNLGPFAPSALKPYLNYFSIAEEDNSTTTGLPYVSLFTAGKNDYVNLYTSGIGGTVGIEKIRKLDFSSANGDLLSKKDDINKRVDVFLYYTNFAIDLYGTGAALALSADKARGKPSIRNIISPEADDFEAIKDIFNRALAVARNIKKNIEDFKTSLGTFFTLLEQRESFNYGGGIYNKIDLHLMKDLIPKLQPLTELFNIIGPRYIPENREFGKSDIVNIIKEMFMVQEQQCKAGFTFDPISRTCQPSRRRSASKIAQAAAGTGNGSGLVDQPGQTGGRGNRPTPYPKGEKLGTPGPTVGNVPSTAYSLGSLDSTAPVASPTAGEPTPMPDKSDEDEDKETVIVGEPPEVETTGGFLEGRRNVYIEKNLILLNFPSKDFIYKDGSDILVKDAKGDLLVKIYSRIKQLKKDHLKNNANNYQNVEHFNIVSVDAENFKATIEKQGSKK